MSPWWVFAGGVAGFAGSVLWLLLWHFGVRAGLTEKGWKYTSIAVVLFPLVVVLPGSVQVILRELTVIEPGGVADTALSFTVAALAWIVLGGLVAGMMFDALRRRRPSTS